MTRIRPPTSITMSVREMPEYEQDDQDSEQDTDDTAWPPSIVPGIRPSREGTDQQQNENDDENRDQHGLKAQFRLVMSKARLFVLSPTPGGISEGTS